MIEIYVDGASRGNGKQDSLGAYGFIVVQDDKVIYTKCKTFKGVTNNQMELQAVIEALIWAVQNDYKTIIVYSDSRYICDGMTQWLQKWKRNRWITSSKEPVKNKEYWITLDTLDHQIDVTYKWIKGHSDNIYNSMADELCNTAMDLIIEKM